jgi:hypothetical protein
MTVTRRNVMWPLIIMAIGCVWLLMVTGAFPEAIKDLIIRAWPALLILFGFDVLVGRRRVRVSRWRVPLSLVGLVGTVVLLGVVVWLAYANQADKLRTDNSEIFAGTLTDEITQMRIEITMDHTTVTVNPAQENSRELSVEFLGSKESDVEVDWSVEGETAILIVTETHPNAIPKLEDYGRGTLDVVLPTDVTIEQLDLTVNEGDVTVDMQPLQMGRFELVANDGKLTLDLPAQLASSDSLVKVHGGGIELTIPEEMALWVNPAPGTGKPNYDYDVLRYFVVADGTLRPENTENFPEMNLSVSVKGGTRVTVNDPN